MLHIHNGDATADTAKQSTLAGEHLAWRESLITGPTPSGLSVEDWRRLRAQHLSASYGVEERECEQGLLTQEQAVASFSAHDEVVLWFEHDLFCQLHLVYLLNWFSQRDLQATKLSLICIDRFPGKERFRGLGELNAGELSSLFPARQPVTDEQLNLASKAWAAYSSAHPGAIETVSITDSSALPFLAPALRAHLKRFPATTNGLGRIENCALALIDEGLDTFSAFFSRFGDREPLYGMGDAQVWLSLQRLSLAQQPLLSIEGVTGATGLTRALAVNAKLKLTELGKSVLHGAADFVEVNGIDQWLGGVHLSGKNDIWRWDDKREQLLQT